MQGFYDLRCRIRTSKVFLKEVLYSESNSKDFTNQLSMFQGWLKKFNDDQQLQGYNFRDSSITTGQSRSPLGSSEYFRVVRQHFMDGSITTGKFGELHRRIPRISGKNSLNLREKFEELKGRVPRSSWKSFRMFKTYPLSHIFFYYLVNRLWRHVTLMPNILLRL